MMEYKVTGLVSPNHVGEFHLQDCNLEEWIEADSPLEAAALFILEHPAVNTSPILVVDKDYNMGNYPLENVKLQADYICGLRW
jgi:hypothetical protein